MEFGKDILQQIGDVTFIVIVDPVHHEISALKSDLSQPIQHGVDAALNSGMAYTPFDGHHKRMVQ